MARRSFEDKYDMLINEGFLSFEAEELQNVPFNVPYMQRLRDTRSDIVSRFGIGEDLRDFVMGEYEDNGWYSVQSPGEFSPWAMLREFEDAYRIEFPDYES